MLYCCWKTVRKNDWDSPMFTTTLRLFGQSGMAKLTTLVHSLSWCVRKCNTSEEEASKKQPLGWKQKALFKTWSVLLYHFSSPLFRLLFRPSLYACHSFSLILSLVSAVLHQSVPCHFISQASCLESPGLHVFCCCFLIFSPFQICGCVRDLKFVYRCLEVPSRAIFHTHKAHYDASEGTVPTTRGWHLETVFSFVPWRSMPLFKKWGETQETHKKRSGA